MEQNDDVPADASPRADRWLRGCLMAAGLLTCLHVVALPLAIPYDGHEYIDFADVLLSERFPGDWQPPIRTPGYPLLLKGMFAVVGRQPLAIVGLNALIAWATLLVIARGARMIAGSRAAGWAVLATAGFPLAIAYQHHALTETAVAAVVTAVTGILLVPAATPRAGWIKALALAATLAGGYFIRQSIQFVFPAATALFVLSLTCRPGSCWHAALRHPPFAVRTMLGQTAVVAILPVALSLLWEPYVDSRGIRDYMLKQGIVRQALLPPRDPLLGAEAADYTAAIGQAWAADGLVSGIEPAMIGTLAGTLYPALDPAGPTFLRLATRHPGRFAAGVGRTLMLFAGWPARQSTNQSAEHAVFGPTLGLATNRIDPGPAHLDAGTRAVFSQPTAANPIAKLLWWLAPPFDHGLVPAGFLAVVILGVVGVFGRDIRLVIVAGIPCAYLLCHALMLAAEDRYAFPAQPLLLAALASLICRVGAVTGPIGQALTGQVRIFPRRVRAARRE